MIIRAVDRCFYKFASLLVVVLLATVTVDADDTVDVLPKPLPNALAPKDPIFHAELSRGVELVYNDEFEVALAILDSLLQDHPDHPDPHFYRAATLQTWMSSYRFNGFQDTLEASVDRAIKAGEVLVKKQPKDPWLDFYMGGAYGYRAYFKLGRYNFLGAYRDGKRGIAHLRLSLLKEPKLYDAYLGLGSYYYWRTARSSMLRWLLFWMPDKRDLGLAQIELSMNHGRYSQDESRLVLVTALYDNGQYERALKVLDARIAAGQRPNMFELYLRGRLSEKLNRWDVSESMFLQLLERLEEKEWSAIGYRVECRYRLAYALSKQGKQAEALKLAQEGIALSEKRNPDTELESVLSSYNDVKKGLDRLYRDLSKKQPQVDTDTHR